MEKIKGWAVPIIAILFLYISGIGCPIKFITGISCAGCGMTRAWLCLLSGHPIRAFSFHPLYPLPALYILIYIFKHKTEKRVLSAIGGGAVILFIAVYIIRMVNPTDSVVIFHPSDGIIFKAFKFLRGLFSWLTTKEM